MRCDEQCRLHMYQKNQAVEFVDKYLQNHFYKILFNLNRLIVLIYDFWVESCSTRVPQPSRFS